MDSIDPSVTLCSLWTLVNDRFCVTFVGRASECWQFCVIRAHTVATLASHYTSTSASLSSAVLYFGRPYSGPSRAIV